MLVNISVIVTHDKRVLLMQRSLTDDYYPGAWGVPGGYMEEVDKSLEDTAIRETFEELGIKIVPSGVVFNNKNDETDTLYIVMAATLDKASDYPDGIVLSDEANDFKWVGKKDIGGLKFTPFTENRIQKVANSL
jgi:ADP-ribose pyrophosphatase YjhB (NUDIX family)